MMTFIYYGNVMICFIVSLLVFKYQNGFMLFPWVMGLTVVTEMLTATLAYGFNTNPFIVYHFYAPIHFTLMACFFYQLVDSKSIKKIIQASIVVYIVTSISLTLLFYEFTDFPGLMANMTGLLLILISLYVLLTLEPIYNVSIYKHPVAWVCVGMIVFYTGTFFLNGIYNYLIVTKSPNRILIHSVINNGLNCFMYSCFIVGLICSHRLKKYAHHQPQHH